jgi:hypothetical protein
MLPEYYANVKDKFPIISYGYKIRYCSSVVAALPPNDFQ